MDPLSISALEFFILGFCLMSLASIAIVHYIRKKCHTYCENIFCQNLVDYLDGSFSMIAALSLALDAIVAILNRGWFYVFILYFFLIPLLIYLAIKHFKSCAARNAQFFKEKGIEDEE